MDTVPPSAVDQRKWLTEKITKGLCLFFFAVSLVFFVYFSLMTVTKMIMIHQPTLALYSQLYDTYPGMLKCPCTQPSIRYSNFLHMEPTFHPICSSNFVTSDWISYLAMPNGTKFPHDFRTTSPYAFQALAMFCVSVRATITDNLLRFYSNQYVSLYVTPSELLEAEMESSIQHFMSSSTNSFLLSLSMIQGTIQGNALFSGLHTNYKQVVQDGDVSSEAQNYDGCTCTSSAKCVFQSAIYDYPNETSLFDVPGFYTGCYVIESLLQSNLQCFFNQKCIERIKPYLPPNATMEVTALGPLSATRFSENSTIQQLLDQLMIEKWIRTMTYKKYYDACNPTECSYSIETTNDATYIATMFITVVGGLTAILNLIVPRLVKFIVHCIQKREARIISQMPMTQT